VITSSRGFSPRRGRPGLACGRDPCREGTELDPTVYPTNAAIRPFALESRRGRDLICCSSSSMRRTRSATILGPTAAATIECVRARMRLWVDQREALGRLGQDRHRRRFCTTHDAAACRSGYRPDGAEDCAGLFRRTGISDGCAVVVAADVRRRCPHGHQSPCRSGGWENWRWREPDALRSWRLQGGSSRRHLSRSAHSRLALDGSDARPIVGGGHPAVARHRGRIASRFAPAHGLGSDSCWESPQPGSPEADGFDSAGPSRRWSRPAR